MCFYRQACLHHHGKITLNLSYFHIFSCFYISWVYILGKKQGHYKSILYGKTFVGKFFSGNSEKKHLFIYLFGLNVKSDKIQTDDMKFFSGHLDSPSIA